MKLLLIFLIIFIFHSCSKPKTVLICGDHVCINKAEAEQYFEDNLTLEVKLIDKKKSDEFSLIELNLQKNPGKKDKIRISNKDQPNKKLKTLSNSEIAKKKEDLKNRKKNKVKKKDDLKRVEEAKLNINKKKQQEPDNILKLKKPVNKTQLEIVDVCTIIEKCSIDEISKYLIKKGKAKKFPVITARE